MIIAPTIPALAASRAQAESAAKDPSRHDLADGAAKEIPPSTKIGRMSLAGQRYSAMARPARFYMR